jgi:hypothetical protein
MAPLPAHRWTFEESDGSVARDEIGQVNATLANANRISPGYSSSKAVHIDGSNSSYISFGKDVGQFGARDFTVSFWVNTTETIRLFDLIGNRTASSHGNFFCVRMTGNHESMPHGMVTAEVDEDGNGKNYIAVQSAAAGLNDGRWHSVAVARSGNTLTLYIDGAISASRSGAGVANIQNGNDFRIGRSLVMDVLRFAPNALFDDVRIYDAALSPSPGLAKADLLAAIARYAPVVRFHPQEQYLPSSVEWFLDRAWLCDQYGGKAQASVANLPATPPADGNDHHYWLELKDNASRGGNMPSAVAYVHAKPAAVAGFTDIAFWFFYPFNGPGAAHVFPFQDYLAFDKFGEHTGDWENVVLRVDNNSKALTGVYLSQHNSGEWITDLNAFTKQNGRIVVYASRNGHASYSRPGANPTEEKNLSAPWPFPGDIFDFYLINDCADGGQSLDCAAHYQLVSADYLGAEKPDEPRWLNFFYRWGPHITYPAGTIDQFVRSLGVAAWLISPLMTWLLDKLPSEVKEEDGPTGPKTKGSWLGRPED